MGPCGTHCIISTINCEEGKFRMKPNLHPPPEINRTVRTITIKMCYNNRGFTVGHCCIPILTKGSITNRESQSSTTYEGALGSEAVYSRGTSCIARIDPCGQI